jgi:hypothetical protein
VTTTRFSARSSPLLFSFSHSSQRIHHIPGPGVGVLSAHLPLAHDPALKTVYRPLPPPLMHVLQRAYSTTLHALGVNLRVQRESLGVQFSPSTITVANCPGHPLGASSSPADARRLRDPTTHPWVNRNGGGISSWVIWHCPGPLRADLTVLHPGRFQEFDLSPGTKEGVMSSQTVLQLHYLNIQR